MYKFNAGSIPMEPFYVCVNKAEARKAEKHGVPYILMPGGFTNEDLIKFVFYPILKQKFPGVDWVKVFGRQITDRKEIIVQVPGGECKQHKSGDDAGDIIVTDQATEKREFDGGLADGEDDYGQRDLNEYLGDMAAYVSIEDLQALNLLPSFLDDIADAIKRNLYGINWTEGYNKKLGAPIGKFDSAYEKPNLMILDVSGSIPKGVSATMLTLIDTLRTRANADLIITGSCSMFWGIGQELPSPQWIRNHIGYGNEATQFYGILQKKVAGRKFGNVICFGDNDSPMYFGSAQCPSMPGTEVNKLWCFHTMGKYVPGYAEWCTRPRTSGVKAVEIEYNTAWCKYMKRNI